MTRESWIVRKLREVASRLTSDAELQKDLLQEMLIHLLRVQTDLPNRTMSWYIKSCEFRARNYLKHGRSIDSIKRARNRIPLRQVNDDPHRDAFSPLDTIDPVDLQSELFTNEIVNLVMLNLTATQQEVFSLLMKGFRVREIARELHITHPAIIKHRRKIAHIASQFLEDSTAFEVVVGSNNGSKRNGRPRFS